MANKYKPYWSVSLNKERLADRFSVNQLEKIGRKHGIEVDKRLKKETIVDKIYEVL